MGKYLCTADIHIVSTNTRYRVDNLSETSLKKLAWCVSTANENTAQLLIAGDLFDSIKMDWGIFNSVVSILRQAQFTPLLVHGQHEVPYHSDTLESSPLYALYLANVAQLMKPEKAVIAGVGWGVKHNPTEIQAEILMIHKCVTAETPPPFLKDAISAKDLAIEYPNCKYIVSGDYHTPHITKYKGRTVLNCGTTLRKNKDQYNFKPTVYLLDTTKDTVKILHIPIQPPEKVFDLSMLKTEDEIGITLDTSNLEEMLNTKTVPMDFKSVVFDIIAKTDKHNVTAIIDEVYKEL